MDQKIKKMISMKGKEKITMLTAYDYNTAFLEEKAGIDLILVGDSLSMVVLGHESTRDATLQDMLRHTEAVARGAKNTIIVGDMPYRTYDTKDQAVKNAHMFIQSGADNVKIENKPEIVRSLVENGFDVMGHIGLTPQTITEFKVQGKDNESAERLLQLAKQIEEAGAYSLVLECIPSSLAKKITESIKIPTIGIGAGPFCDGQVLVVNDMLGMFDKFKPKFVKRYAELNPLIFNAISEYKKEVKNSKFPNMDFSYG